VDERLDCYMVYKKDSTFSIKLGLQNIFGFDTSKSKDSHRFVYGKSGSVEELIQ